METKNGVEAIEAKNAGQWRSWLEANHASKKSVWLIIYRKESAIPSVYYNEAVDEALCYGWIDSKPNKRDDESYYQFFSKRNPKSNWSKVNKSKVERLLKAGKMSKAGKAMIRLAKETGTWSALDQVENLINPEDLQNAFDKNKKAYENWRTFPPSVRRGILEWIFNAKRPETRQKRILETVSLAEENIRANQYRKG